MKLTYLLILFMIFSSCKTINFFDYGDDNIRKPKRIITSVYKTSDENGELAYQHVEEFDDKGNLKSHTSLGKHTSKLTYNQDKKGDMVKLEVFSDDLLTGEDLNSYNGKGLIVLKKSWRHKANEFTITTYRYNQIGREVERIGYERGRFLFRNTFEYPSRNKMVSVSFDSLGNQTNKITHSSPKTRVRISVWQNSKNDTIAVYKDFYDRHNRKERQESYHPSRSENKIQITVYNRELDSKKNWVYESYAIDGKKGYSSKRTIEY